MESVWYNSVWIFGVLLLIAIILFFIIKSNQDSINNLSSEIESKKFANGVGKGLGFFAGIASWF